MNGITRRSFGLLATTSVATLASGVGTARADPALPPNVVLFCEPTLEPVMREAGRVWGQRSHAPVQIFMARSDVMVEQMVRGARCDVLVVTTGVMDATAAPAKLVKIDSRFDGWRNRLVVAARGARGTPTVLGPGADLASLLGQGRLAVPDASIVPAGAEARAALDKLGLWQGLAGRVMGAESAEGAAFLVAEGQASLGVMYATDVAADERLAVVANIPDDAYPRATYAAALARDAVSGQAPAFRDFLRGPEANALFKASGLEIL